MRKVLLILTLLMVSLSFCSCSSGKKAINTENKTSINLRQNEKAAAELVIGYQVDTTRECETTIVIERTEYYPSVTDSSTGTDNAKHQQIKVCEDRGIFLLNQYPIV